MPFITQGKTNLTYILIVVVLAVIVGGGVSWLSMKQNIPFLLSASAQANSENDTESVCGNGICEFIDVYNPGHPKCWQDCVSVTVGFEDDVTETEARDILNGYIKEHGIITIVPPQMYGGMLTAWMDRETEPDFTNTISQDPNPDIKWVETSRQDEIAMVVLNYNIGEGTGCKLRNYLGGSEYISEFTEGGRVELWDRTVCYYAGWTPCEEKNTCGANFYIAKYADVISSVYTMDSMTPIFIKRYIGETYEPGERGLPITAGISDYCLGPWGLTDKELTKKITDIIKIAGPDCIEGELPEYVPGEIIVGFKEDVTDKEAILLLESFNLTYRSLLLSGYYVINIPEGTELDWIETLEKEDIVESVELNFTVRALETTKPEEIKNYVPGEILIGFKEYVIEEEARNLIESYNLTFESHFSKAFGAWVKATTGSPHDYLNYLESSEIVSWAEIRSGDILVHFNEKATEETAKDLINSHDSLEIMSIILPPKWGLAKVPEGKELEWIDKLQTEDIIIYAELNRMVRATETTTTEPVAPETIVPEPAETTTPETIVAESKEQEEINYLYYLVIIVVIVAIGLIIIKKKG